MPANAGSAVPRFRPLVPEGRAWLGLWHVGAFLGATIVLVAGVVAVGAPLSLAALCLFGAGVGLLVWPDAATMIVAALLYLNVPAVAHNRHGVPTAVAASMFALLALPFLHHVVILRQRPRVDLVLRLMLCYLGVMVLSSLGARDAALAADRVLAFVLEGLVTYFLFTTVVRSHLVLKRLLYTVLLAGAVLGSLTLYQAATGSYRHQFGGLAVPESSLAEKIPGTPAAAAGDALFGVQERPSGPMLNTNYYAQIMLVLVPLAVALMRTERARTRRLLTGILGAVILVGGVFLTYSRGAILVLPILGIAALWLRWARPRHLLLPAVLCLAGILAFAPALYERLSGVTTVADLRATGANKDTDVSIRGRATEMLAGMLAFRDHPVLGVGPGQYEPFYSLAYSQQPGIKFKTLQEARAAHSLYVQVAAELGLLGLVLFLAMPAWLVRELWRERRRLSHVPALADLAAGLILSIVAYHAAGLFLSFAYERYYWFLLALAGAALAMLRSTPSPARDGMPGSGRESAHIDRMGATSWTSRAY